MIIGDRLMALRTAKNLSQSDIEKRIGLLRCYISRVENGHTVPALETLEKFARALEVPFYQLFYDGEEPPKVADVPQGNLKEPRVIGLKGKDASFAIKLLRTMKKLKKADQELLLSMAQRMAKAKK